MSVGARRPVLTSALLLAATLTLAACGSSNPGAAATPTGTPSADATGTATPADPAPSTDPSDAPAGTDPVDGATLPPRSGTVTVTTTFWGWDPAAGAATVGGYADTLEPAGTCTLTLTGPAATVTRSAAATPDASTMSCGDLSVAGAELATGTWQAVLSYASPTSTGTAAAVTVDVP